MNKRRTLIVALGAGALAAPFGSFAQQQGKVWRVGFLSQRHVDFVDSDYYYGPFRQGMRELGYVEGRKVSRVAVLMNPSNRAHTSALETIEAAARARSIKIQRKNRSATSGVRKWQTSVRTGQVVSSLPRKPRSHADTSAWSGSLRTNSATRGPVSTSAAFTQPGAAAVAELVPDKTAVVTPRRGRALDAADQPHIFGQFERGLRRRLCLNVASDQMRDDRRLGRALDPARCGELPLEFGIQADRECHGESPYCNTVILHEGRCGFKSTNKVIE